MEIATSQLPRIVRLALIGAGTAFAWIVVTLLLGFGTGQAHADDADDGGLLGGALGAVTSAVDTTAASAEQAVATVADAAATVVDTVVASTPAPAQPLVRHAVESAGTAVAAVTQPVSDAVPSGAVSGVTDPVVDLVAEVPVVGDVAAAVGLDHAVSEVGGTADETLGGLVEAVAETGATVGRPPVGGTLPIPALPPLPALPGLSGSAIGDGTNESAAGIDGVARLEAADASAIVAAFLRAVSVTASVTAAGTGAVFVSSAALGASGLSGLAGGLCPPSASAGPGGAGLGAWALVALVPLAAHRAWVRRAGPEDEHAPPAPAGSTDVSPD